VNRILTKNTGNGFSFSLLTHLLNDNVELLIKNFFRGKYSLKKHCELNENNKNFREKIQEYEKTVENTEKWMTLDDFSYNNKLFSMIGEIRSEKWK